VRGEFIGVWKDAWPEIWLPLVDHDDVPGDVFCELFREIAASLRDPTENDAISLLLDDAILLREAFEHAAACARPELGRTAVVEAFDVSSATDSDEGPLRRAAAVSALEGLIGESAGARLAESLAVLGSDPEKRAAATERARDLIINDRVRSREAFERIESDDLVGERAVVGFFEGAFDVLDGMGGDELSNRYFNLLAEFINKFSLRYDLRRPCIVCPTLPGVFASLVRDVRALASLDPHLDALMGDFEDAVRDLRHGCSEARIKTCIQRQVNLLEAFGNASLGVSSATLGAVCDQLGTWPHHKLKIALKSMYGFASDYPGIRHGGTPANALRAVDMRDLVAVSVLLAGFTPYLSNGLDLDAVYRGT
jgi:hypothetical protein